MLSGGDSAEAMAMHTKSQKDTLAKLFAGKVKLPVLVDGSTKWCQADILLGGDMKNIGAIVRCGAGQKYNIFTEDTIKTRHFMWVCKEGDGSASFM